MYLPHISNYKLRNLVFIATLWKSEYSQCQRRSCGVSQADAQAEAAKWLKRLGIEESRWQASPVTFSGGEQQRLNLARAFIAAPRLLLLDEPTASLDARSKAIVLEMIGEAKAAGVTIVTVSHDTASLASLADNSFILEEGNHADLDL